MARSLPRGYPGREAAHEQEPSCLTPLISSRQTEARAHVARLTIRKKTKPGGNRVLCEGVKISLPDDPSIFPRIRFVKRWRARAAAL
jgi:hypothetical protein